MGAVNSLFRTVAICIVNFCLAVQTRHLASDTILHDYPSRGRRNDTYCTRCNRITVDVELRLVVEHAGGAGESAGTRERGDGEPVPQGEYRVLGQQAEEDVQEGVDGVSLDEGARQHAAQLPTGAAGALQGGVQSGMRYSTVSENDPFLIFFYYF